MKVHVRRSYPEYGQLRTVCGLYLDVPGRDNPHTATKWSEVSCGTCKTRTYNDDGEKVSSEDYLALTRSDRIESSNSRISEGATKCTNCGDKLAACRKCGLPFCVSCAREYANLRDGRCLTCTERAA